MKPRNNGIDIAELFPGQGTQKERMLWELANSGDATLSRAAEEVLDILKSFGPDGSDVIDIYYNGSVDPIKINNTRNVQPGLAAHSAILHRALENKLGYGITPDTASGYSLGAVISLYPLGVLSLEDMLNLVMMRGESMSSIKPGWFTVITFLTNETANVNRINWKLRGTKYRVTIRHDPSTISISGRSTTKHNVERRLSRDGKIIPADQEKFYAPFHNCWEMRPYARVFEHNVARYCESRKKETGEDVFRDLAEGLFVTNGGKTLTKGDDIMKYISYGHIVQLCDFRRTMERIGKLDHNCIGIGQMDFQRKLSERNGYIGNFYVFSDSSKLDEAARWYDVIMEKRAREVLPGRKLISAYQA